MKKPLILTIIMTMTLTMVMSQTSYRNVGVDSNAVQVGAGYINILSLNIAYPSTSIVYLKFYDKATKPHAKTDTPVLTYQIGTDAALMYNLQTFSQKVAFQNGCWIRCVTAIQDTSQTKVQPATKPLVEITY